MAEQPEKKPEMLEAESQLKRTEREIESVEKELLALREKLRVAEQKEIDARAAAGKEPTDFEPTPEMGSVMKEISKTEGSLGLLRLRETEQKNRIGKLAIELIEAELVAVSKVTVELKRREQELSEELVRVQKKLAAAEKKTTELADRIAAGSEDGPD